MDQSAFQGEKVVITGATGFIGANLVRAMVKAGADVFAIVRESSDLHRLSGITQEFNILYCDLLDLDATARVIKTIEPNYVFNLATTRDADDWHSLYQLNAIGVLNILRAALGDKLKRFVHTGGSLEYGFSEAPLSESDRLDPQSNYGASKAAGSIMLNQAAVDGAPVSILRLFHVYGPMEPSHRLVPTAIRAIKSGDSIRLTKPGLRHDFIHVDDVIEACMVAAQNQQSIGRVFNIGSGEQTTNETIVGMLEKIIDKKANLAPEKFPSRSWDRNSWQADISRAKDLLGWRPKTDLIAGLTKTVAAHD